MFLNRSPNRFISHLFEPLSADVTLASSWSGSDTTPPSYGVPRQAKRQDASLSLGMTARHRPLELAREGDPEPRQNGEQSRDIQVAPAFPRSHESEQVFLNRCRQPFLRRQGLLQPAKCRRRRLPRRSSPPVEFRWRFAGLHHAIGRG